MDRTSSLGIIYPLYTLERKVLGWFITLRKMTDNILPCACETSNFLEYFNHVVINLYNYVNEVIFY